MGIRNIKNKAGAIVGYQAFAGAGAAGSSAYFSAAKYGADRARTLADFAAVELIAAQPRRQYPARAGNAGGIPGLRLQYQRPQAQEGTPVLYAVATWQAKGRAVSRKASTDRHGMLGAVERMLKERENGIGQPLGLTPRQALTRMKRAFNGAAR